MLNSFSSAQIERFKREAKQLCHTTSLTHSQALDNIAVANGHSNWSLLMKHRDPSPVSAVRHEAPAPKLSSLPRASIKFTRTQEEMRQALCKIPQPRYPMRSRIEEARLQIQDISHNFASAENAVDVAVDYVTCLLAMPRFKINGATKANWEMRCWLPYCAHPVSDDFDDNKIQILVNRRYKPVGQGAESWAKYEEFEHLHLSLNKEQLQDLADHARNDGYLFDDGSAPWFSRRDAEIYLRKLRSLQEMLKG